MLHPYSMFGALPSHNAHMDDGIVSSTEAAFMAKQYMPEELCDVSELEILDCMAAEYRQAYN